MSKTIEQFVAETILQDSTVINIAGKDYTVAPPSVATLIEASALISRIPDLIIDEDKDIMSSVLANAHKCDFLGDLAAVLILGKRNLKGVKKSLFGLLKRPVDNKEILSKIILEQMDAEELQKLIVELLQRMKVSFFFSTTIFLKEVNMIKPTKETTASGLPSPELQKNTT